MEPDIQELVRQAKKGEKDAFGKLYNLYLKKIYRFIYFSVQNKELTEDLTQTTFYKAWISLQNFSLAKGTFQAYLFAIARNLVIDHARKKKEVNATDLGVQFEQVVSDQADPEEKVLKHDVKIRIRQALDKLDELEKNIIVLRFFEELEYSEIAKITGKKQGTIRVMIHRILKNLEKYFRE